MNTECFVKYKNYAANKSLDAIETLGKKNLAQAEILIVYTLSVYYERFTLIIIIIWSVVPED